MQFQFNLQTVDTQSYFVLILEIKKKDRKFQQGAREENSELKQRLNNLASNFDNLSEEHKSLQTQFKQEKEKENLKCNKCENDSENVPNLKKNRSEYRATSFQM